MNNRVAKSLRKIAKIKESPRVLKNQGRTVMIGGAGKVYQDLKKEYYKMTVLDKK